MTFIFNKVKVVAQPIEVIAVDFGYPQTDVLRGFTTSIDPAAVTVLVGSNGSGKSTLLELLAGVRRPARGEVRANVDDIAFAVQRSRVTDTFPITVAEAVMMGRWRRLGLWRRPARSDRAVVDHWIDELGLTGLRHRTLGELSGGQRQRVLLAQAFAQESPLLLLDEPTTGLDAATGALVMAHLRRLADEGATVVVATHDPALIEAADRRIDLDEAAPH